MQKVYLLLRGNQQTGPYSLEELLQFDLKPFDLIWIEGRSAGWYYPQEIQALQPHLPFVTQPSEQQLQASVTPIQNPKEADTKQPKKVFVAMPSSVGKETRTASHSFAPLSNENERTNYATTAPKVEEPEALKTTYAKSLDEVETDYMNWVYKKKSNKKVAISIKGVIVACLLVGIAIAGWKILQPSVESPIKASPEQTAFLSKPNELPETQPIAEEEPSSVNKPTKSKKQQQNKAETLPVQKSGVVKTIQPAEQMVNPTPQNGDEPSPRIVEKNEPVVADEKSVPVTTEAPKEKKKLRDKIFDIFKKKPDIKEEPKPVEQEGGQRQSTRRETGSSLAQMVTVKFTIPNEWMMGIKGAKATITNRSSETIAKAVVEVTYYNDDNDLLDKKTITFGMIKSKQTQTIAVPDHQTATRLEYNVVSATPAEEPFAKR